MSWDRAERWFVRVAGAVIITVCLAFPESAPPRRECDQIVHHPGVPGYAIEVRDC